MADPTDPAPPPAPTVPAELVVAHPAPDPNRATEWIIEGKTPDGRQFRPSDWGERLCGVLSGFRPQGGRGQYAHLGYSPYARPASIGTIRCVVVDERLREIEPMAWDFVQSFARENGLPFRKVD